MPSQTSTDQMHQTLADGLKNASEVYDHITPPNEYDDNDCTRFIGRCLVELNEEQQKHERRLQMIEQSTRESPFDGPTYSSQNDKIDAIWEEIGELKGKVENIEDNVQDIADRVQAIEEKLTSLEIEERFDYLEYMADSFENRFDALEKRMDALEKRFDALEKRFDTLEKRFDTLEDRLEKLEKRFDCLEEQFKQFGYEQQTWSSLQRNGLASRFYQPVHPVGMTYTDANGKSIHKMPPWSVKKVGYYWKLHNRERHQKLIDMHKFYQLDFRHWALDDYDDEESENSNDTDDLDKPLSSIEQAVSMYPDRAVMVLFSELGLAYSVFEGQAEREQHRLTVLQKRLPEGNLSTLERRVKRPSDGSTTDIFTELLGSSTASVS